MSFPREQRVESEGLSRELAKQVVAAFQEAGLPVHPFKPVRDKIIRNNGEWVPAVLRYNSIPAKILLEVCNLANDQDRACLQTRAYRQQVAEAVRPGAARLLRPGRGSARRRLQRRSRRRQYDSPLLSKGCYPDLP